MANKQTSVTSSVWDFSFLLSRDHKPITPLEAEDFLDAIIDLAEEHGLSWTGVLKPWKQTEMTMVKPMANKCDQCHEHPIEFVSPGSWCAPCWAKWWFTEMTPTTPEEREELIQEAIEMLDKVADTSEESKAAWGDRIRELAEKMIEQHGC